MPDEVLRVLSPQGGQTILDCTTGRGGHCAMILPHITPGGRYIGLDTDPGNIVYLQHRFAGAPVRCDFVHANFANARAVLDGLGVGSVDGLLADLGFASIQVDDPQRGLSFMQDGPLDMRLDPTAPATAADLVNEADERELADIIFQYGEERHSRRIASKIVEARRKTPITTTTQLAALCASAYGGAAGRSRIHPATRTFQALRIAVNAELENLRVLMKEMGSLMAGGGRAVVISFHSLEDRLVKRAMVEYVAGGHAEKLTRKAVQATESEIAVNRRSRSAKLRGLLWKNTSQLRRD